MSELKLKPEPTLVARTETNTLNTVGSSPSLNINPLNRVGSSPRSAESPSCSVQNLSATPAPQGLRLVNATVKSVTSVGEGDRVSVDLCNLLNPGEALLVSWNELIIPKPWFISTGPRHAASSARTS